MDFAFSHGSLPDGPFKIQLPKHVLTQEVEHNKPNKIIIQVQSPKLLLNL